MVQSWLVQDGHCKFNFIIYRSLDINLRWLTKFRPSNSKKPLWARYSNHHPPFNPHQPMLDPALTQKHAATQWVLDLLLADPRHVSHLLPYVPPHSRARAERFLLHGRLQLNRLSCLCVFRHHRRDLHEYARQVGLVRGARQTHRPQLLPIHHLTPNGCAIPKHTFYCVVDRGHGNCLRGELS